MDPQTNLPDLVEDLEVNIDELTEALQPLLSTPLHMTASSLPLLDKAKLYTLAAYAIESLLFSTLQASGANAKAHAIFPELARLRGYFAKIKEVEARGSKEDRDNRARLDVGAAQRFIKHGLAGNDRYDLNRAERMAKEKARAQIKAKQINKKFDDEGKEEVQSGGTTPKKRSAEEATDPDSEADSDVSNQGSADPEAKVLEQPILKKPRIATAHPTARAPPTNYPKQETNPETNTTGPRKSKRQRNSTLARQHHNGSEGEEEEEEEGEGEEQQQSLPSAPKPHSEIPTSPPQHHTDKPPPKQPRKSKKGKKPKPKPKAKAKGKGK
ncbi:hypothetical protein ACN47E_000564 [Coniothyrium glycines]